MTAPKPTIEELLKEATTLARMSGLYIVRREETTHGQKMLMYLLFRRLNFAMHGAFIGKRHTAEGLLKLIKKVRG